MGHGSNDWCRCFMATDGENYCRLRSFDRRVYTQLLISVEVPNKTEINKFICDHIMKVTKNGH